MTAMVQDFDGVRELSMEEVDAVAGGPVWFLVAAGAAILLGGCATTQGECTVSADSDGNAEGSCTVRW